MTTHRRRTSHEQPRHHRLLLVLVTATLVVPACLPDPVPWVPTDEDTGPDSGPDPGTCEHRRDCPLVVK